MAEVKREPHIIVSSEFGEIQGFDENHTLADIARWVLQNRSDGEELRDLLDEMLEEMPEETVH